MDIPVVDTEGNVICTVSAPQPRALGIVSGAYIMYCGVKVLVYQGATWVCLNPELATAILDMLITGFQIIQNQLNSQVTRADHDGTSYVTARTSSGNECKAVGGGLWACRY